MEFSSYKDFVVSRGLKYHYYVSPPQNGKPTIVLLHGFPGNSYNWRHQIKFFASLGYGLIVPDLLGFGGTDRPADPKAYTYTPMSKDIVELVEHEKPTKAICIGHDWGSVLASRVANFHQDKFAAYGFLAVGYIPPVPMTYEELTEGITASIGYEQFGYWKFLASPEAPEIIEKNVDSFLSLIWTANARDWYNHLALTGALKAWVESGKTCPTFLPPDEYEETKRRFLANGGVAGSLNWYKVWIENLEIETNKAVPPSAYVLNKPVFFGGALRDFTAIPALSRAALYKLAPEFTFEDYYSGHWVAVEQPDALNADLLKWIEGIGGLN